MLAQRISKELIANAYLLVSFIVFLATATLYLSPASADEDIIYMERGFEWNGKRIYLSAAWHTADAGARGECRYPDGTSRTERTMARNLGEDLADHTVQNVPYSGLTRRGYRVRLGRGDPNENTYRSNTWGANAHVPLHSNAASGSGTCANREANIRGTWQIYRGGDGSVLPGRLRAQLNDISPGTNDRVCTIQECTSYSCLIELCGIDAHSASYSETEFHDWNRGIKFLTEDRLELAWTMATAIDNHFH